MLGLSAIVISISVAIATIIMVFVADRYRDLLVEFFELDDLGLTDSMQMVQMQVSPYATGLILMLVIPLVTGLLITSVSRSVIGQKASLGQVWSLTKPKLGWLLLLSLILGVAALIAVFLYVMLVVIIAETVAGWVAVVVGIIGALALVVGFFWIGIRTLLIAPVLVLEESRFWPAFKRSWLLTRGSFWRVLGIYLLTQVIVSVVTSVVAVPITFVAMFLMFGSETAGPLPMIILALGNVLTYTITTSFAAAVTALLYIDLRIRREGLDVELTAAAQEQGN